MKEIKIYSAGDFPTYLPKLNGLFDDLFSGGKGLRSHLVREIGKTISLSSETLSLLCQTIEFIHNASLLHDDLVDRAFLRRNKTSAWLKYSPEYAVLAGDYLLARVMVNLSRYGNIALIQFTSEMISDLLEGEWIQDSLVNDWNISQSDLDRVHNLKTGSLFQWCLKAPFLASRHHFEPSIIRILGEAGILLGQLFQRSDDLLDFDVRNEEKKDVLGDLKSGYLNSFGIFLTHRLKPEIKQKMVLAKSMEELIHVLGQDYFDSKLDEFDEINTSLISIYQHHVKHLNSLFETPNEDLQKFLLGLPRPLYWRKK